jgi:hypothetical protein
MPDEQYPVSPMTAMEIKLNQEAEISQLARAAWACAFDELSEIARQWPCMGGAEFLAFARGEVFKK